MCACQVTTTVSNSLRPHGLQPARLFCPWGFSRQEYWSGWPCPPPEHLPHPGIEPVSLMSPALAGGFSTTCTTWEAAFDTEGHELPLRGCDCKMPSQLAEQETGLHEEFGVFYNVTASSIFLSFLSLCRTTWVKRTKESGGASQQDHKQLEGAPG